MKQFDDLVRSQEGRNPDGSTATYLEVQAARCRLDRLAVAAGQLSEAAFAKEWGYEAWIDPIPTYEAEVQ